MSSYSLTHVSDPDLVRGLTSAVAQDRSATVVVLAHLAEFDARRLYVPAAFPSTYLYCLHELHLSEDAAYKRIQAARAARQFFPRSETLALVQALPSSPPLPEDQRPPVPPQTRA